MARGGSRRFEAVDGGVVGGGSRRFEAVGGSRRLVVRGGWWFEAVVRGGCSRRLVVRGGGVILTAGSAFSYREISYPDVTASSHCAYILMRTPPITP